MREFLDYSLLCNPTEKWLIALAFIVGGFVAGKIVSWICSNVLKVISARTKTRLDDILLAIAEKPLVVIVTVAGIAIGVHQLSMQPSVAIWVDKAFVVLVTVVIAWTLVRTFDAIITEYLVPYSAKTEGNLDDQLIPIVRQIVKIAIWLIAILMALKNVGYDVGALLAGLGLGGVAIALAAKDTLSNFFGSIAVFVDRPFQLNDRVKVAGFDGNIIEIGLRTSRLRTLDNRVVTIPNSLFTAGPIENITSEPSSKVTLNLSLSRSTSPEKLEEAVSILKAIGVEVEGTTDKPIAAVTAIGDWSFKVLFVFFVKKGADYNGVINDVHLELLRRFKAAKIELAVPTHMQVGTQS